MSHMDGWISKKGKKGAWNLFLKEFLENIKNEDFGLRLFGKGQILVPFSGLAPSKLGFFKIKSRLDVLCEHEHLILIYLGFRGDSLLQSEPQSFIY